MSMTLKLLLSCIVCIFVAGGVFYVVQLDDDIIRQVEPSLLPDQRAKLEQQLLDEQKKAAELESDASPEEKAKRYFSLGRTYYILGRYSEAKKMFAKVVVAKKNYPLYLEYYNLLTAMHDFKGARDIAREGLDIFPINIDLWQSLISLEKSYLGADDAKLTSLYIEAFERSEGHPDIAAYFARFQEERGNIAEALKYWKIAAEKAPGVLFYADQVRRLEKASQ